jgi:dienelactone hydrolase
MPWCVQVHKAVQWLKQQPGVDPRRIAVAGFCLGGGAALRYAAAFPQDVAACGVFYGKPLEEVSWVGCNREIQCQPLVRHRGIGVGG